MYITIFRNNLCINKYIYYINYYESNSIMIKLEDATPIEFRKLVLSKDKKFVHVLMFEFI